MSKAVIPKHENESEAVFQEIVLEIRIVQQWLLSRGLPLELPSGNEDLEYSWRASHWSSVHLGRLKKPGSGVSTGRW